MINQIRRLPQKVVEKIAAGEVIERPANIVKELLENSLDAGATSVEVDFANGGRSLRVLDNGHGIHHEELSLALERHSTSKISEAEDLWKLRSFGFRGEALSSVAAVSVLTLTSRFQNSEQGFRVKSHFGDVSEPGPVSSAIGTEIIVEQLFENVPARLKFLKSEAAEHTQIKKVIKAFALAWPQVSFKIKQNGELIHYWPAQESDKRVEAVLSMRLPVISKEVSGGGIKIFYSSPLDVEKSSQNIWIFVQKRWVLDRSIQAAVMEAYRNLLMQGEYPTVVVDLQVPTDEVDVNIHPTKAQVKFLDSSRIYQLVYRNLREALEKSVPKQAVPSVENEQPFLPQNWDSVQYKQKQAEIKADEVPAEKGAWGQLQVLSQSNLTYILAQSRKGLVLVDQHAAHERVAFERLMAGFKSKSLEIQNYLIPITLKFESDEVEALLQSQLDLEQLGVSIDQQSPEHINVRSAPAILKEAAIERALRQIAKEKLEQGESFALESILGDIFATLACHSVVRAGQSLSVEEMRSLLSQMDEFPFSSFCPHGRPVYIELTFSELERQFGRTL